MIHFLHLGLSYQCNLHCRHCFVNVSDDRLSTIDCKHILDVLCEQGLLSVIYTYGEPLLAPFFHEISAYAANKRLMQVLMTNGTQITLETAVLLKVNKISMVYISIDHSKAEKHDRNRGMAGTFSSALHSVRILQKAGVNVGFATTVTDDNAEDLDNIYRLAQKMKVKTISFLSERKNGQLQITEKFPAFADFFEKHIITPQDLHCSFHDVRLNPIILKQFRLGNITEEQKNQLLEMNSCKNAFTLCIHPNGNISKCNFVAPVSTNYFSCDFETYISSEDFKNENSICYT